MAEPAAGVESATLPVVGIESAALADDTGDPSDATGVSFIVPIFNAGRTLESSIGSIRQAAPPDSEIIAVDDGSFDDSLALAHRLADVVVARPCQGGAARARNDGARRARGRVFFFVDSDVTVTPDAVAGALGRLAAGADAVFGSYAALPPPEVRNVATTYKNLLHHYVHAGGAGEASTFWSGFGAVTRRAFLGVSGFDAAVTTGADVEDIHLGYRLRAAGYRIVLDPSLQVLHHKRYTVRSLVASDVLHRAIPWARAMLALRTFSRDLNLRATSLGAGMVAWLALLGVVAIPFVGMAGLVLGSGALLVWVISSRRFLGYVRRTWSLGGMLASTCLLFLYFIYGPIGVGLGTVAHLLRRNRRPVRNRLRLSRDGLSTGLIASVAVVRSPGDGPLELGPLATPPPSCELLVVDSEEPVGLPPGGRWVPVPAHAVRNARRDLALAACRGDMLAFLEDDCVAETGWIQRLEAASRRGDLVVSGAVHHHGTNVRQRAYDIARFWRWRPTQPPAWMPDHPHTNVAYRAGVARALGGFSVPGGLTVRLVAFGARPVRFDPSMVVAYRGPATWRGMTLGLAAIGRRQAESEMQRSDTGIAHRLLLLGFSTFELVLTPARIVRRAVRGGYADRTFWLALPISGSGLVALWLGRVVALLSRRPAVGPLVPDAPVPDPPPWVAADTPEPVLEPEPEPEPEPAEELRSSSRG